MTRTFIPVAVGERFAGGFLTQEGADQVNATRSAIVREYPARQPLGERLARSLANRGFSRSETQLLIDSVIDSDKSIYPWLK